MYRSVRSLTLRLFNTRKESKSRRVGGRTLRYVSSPRGFGGRALEFHFAFLHIRIHDDGIAGKNLTVEELHRQRVLDEPLEGALQGPRAELRVVAFAGHKFPRLVRQLDLNLPLPKQPAQVRELQLDDLPE